MHGPMLKDSFSPWLWRLRAWRKLLAVYGTIDPSLSCRICISRCLQELNSASETRDTPQNFRLSKTYSICWISVDCYVSEMCKFAWAVRLLSTYCNFGTFFRNFWKLGLDFSDNLTNLSRKQIWEDICIDFWSQKKVDFGQNRCSGCIKKHKIFLTLATTNGRIRPFRD